jgi:F420H(2)-dependent quinone reductase
MTCLYGQEHVRRSQQTDGEEGHRWREGSTVLLLTTTGRKSGNESTTPLIYDRDGDDVVVVASQGALPGIRAGTATWTCIPRSASRSRATVSVPGRGRRGARSASGCGGR